MKKTLFAISAIAVLLGFTACTSENETLEPQKGKTITISASTEMPDPSTRTMLDVTTGSDDAGYPVLWTAGDKIKLANEITNSEFTLENDYANKSTGEFTGNALTEDTYTAYYPADYDGTNWPTAQTYEANNIPLGVPMKATCINVDAGGNVDPISFKNEGGILRLNLKLEKDGVARSVKKIVVSSTQLDKDIELNCETVVALTEDGVPFHIAMPAKEYTDLKFTIYDDGAYKCVRSLGTGNTLTVERSKITNVNLTAKTWEFFGLCFTAAEASTVKMTYNGTKMEYSLNDGEWTDWANNSDISLASGGKVYLRLKTGETWGKTANSEFTMTGSLAASGNIMSLVDRTGLSKEIPLQPAQCFYCLFKNCSSLTTAPELPATTLAESCYKQMFYSCSNLTAAPELPATTLEKSCYYQMFCGCSSLTAAPELPAKDLVQSCYYNMFKNCSNLNSVTCLATTYTNQNNVISWLDGVAQTGTFTKAKDATFWSSLTGTNGIPSGWTVVEK